MRTLPILMTYYIQRSHTIVAHKAACDGLQPTPASRLRGTYPHLFDSYRHYFHNGSQSQYVIVTSQHTGNGIVYRIRAVMQVSKKLIPKSIHISYGLFHEFSLGQMIPIKQDIWLTTKFYDYLFCLQVVPA